MTIAESKQVIKTMDNEQKHFTESINRHMELTCNKQGQKYQGQPQRIVEPNLSKRMEIRKQRALQAQLQQQRDECKSYTDVPLEQRMTRT